MEPKVDVGFLFVHGIGEQAQGATVQKWSDALIDLLAGMYGDDAVAVQRARLGPDPLDAAAPAYLDVDVRFSPDEPPVHWRIAEAWWAEAFAPPRFRELAWWAVFVLPYTVLAHFVLKFDRALREPLSAPMRFVAVARTVVFVVISALLLPALALVVGLIVVLGAVPINAVRRVASTLQRGLSETFGDSFVFLGSPARAGAIVHCVAEDLDWLSSRCDRTVVVAHSQGAEVAFRAIRRVKPPRLERFVSLGSGQTKLSMIARATKSGDQWGVWLAPLGLILFVAALVYARDYISREGWDNGWAELLPAFFGIGLAGVGIARAGNFEAPSAAARDTGAKHGWLDLYASRDPVPDGTVYALPERSPEPLPPHQKRSPLLISHRVTNRGSLLRDHTTYRSNTEEVLARIAAIGARASGHALERESPPHRMGARACGRRVWRVQWLRICRWFVLVVGICVLLGNRHHLVDTGRVLTPATSAALDLVPLPAIPDDAGERSDVRTLAALAVVLAAVWIVYAVLAAIWRSWDGNDLRRTYRRHSRYVPEADQYQLWNPEFVALLEAMAGIAVLAGLATARAQISLQDDLLTLASAAETVVGVVLIAFIVLVCWLVFGLLMGWLVPTGLVDRGRQSPTIGQQSAILVPYAVVVVVSRVFELPELGLQATLTLIAGPILLLYVAVPIASSSQLVDRLLQPLRRAARAPERRLPPMPVVQLRRLQGTLVDTVIPQLNAAAAEPSEPRRRELMHHAVVELVSETRRNWLPGDIRSSFDALSLRLSGHADIATHGEAADTSAGGVDLAAAYAAMLASEVEKQLAKLTRGRTRSPAGQVGESG